MSREKTTGPAVSFRLPLGLHDELLRKAAARNLSPGIYVRRQMERALAAAVDPPVQNIRTVEDEAACVHPGDRIGKLATGAWKCACGAVSTDRGVTWRSA